MSCILCDEEIEILKKEIENLEFLGYKLNTFILELKKLKIENIEEIINKILYYLYELYGEVEGQKSFVKNTINGDHDDEIKKKV